VFFVCFRIVMSNILSYHMSLRSEFRVELSKILSYHMSLRSEFVLRFHIKTMFGSSLPPGVRRRPMSYLRYLCLFVCDGVQHILTI
jgi:hypothetical protein